MSLIKYNSGLPSRSINGIMDDFFTRSISDFMGSDFVMNIPSVNVKETEDNYLLELAAPGLNKEDFKIVIENDRMKISAEKEVENEDKQEKFNRREFNYASFSRSFPLPDTVNTEAIQAGYENGVLKITLGKKEEAKPLPPKSIKID